ncbi:transcription termination factor MTEF18, mitochondrial-like [Impatiens glandulifera]|uniref:transcription termination factor MTEF18, mitochondrial-like n=1 Tax=Impatiens glandulifera TaxID=253017 RepID=UPI001FB19ABB|nr:transcription termination factor MTEF18, mitochondrial-like [Impatiens glandulifera]
MRFLPRRFVFSFSGDIFRHISSSSDVKHPRLTNLSKIPYWHRHQVIQHAQEALTDYLHITRSLSFTYSEKISKNSLISLSSIVSEVNFSPSTFSKSFSRFLRYHPVNEFEFFFESIGINHRDIALFLPENKFFFYEDPSILNVACALSEFGFPWNRLGKLYMDDSSIFSQNPDELTKKLDLFKSYGLNSAAVIGICLVFPTVLCGDLDLAVEISSLMIDLISLLKDNLDGWCEFCCKIKVFYDLGYEKGRIRDLLRRNITIFIDFSEVFLIEMVEFFCNFDIDKKEAGLFLLERPDIFHFDLNEKVISVTGILKHFGMDSEELESIGEKFPYIWGRNKMKNLPCVLRALDLQEWVFDKIRNGDRHHLLRTYSIANMDEEDIDRNYIDALEKVKSSKYHIHLLSKLEFLHGIGFGENKLTMQVLNGLHGTGLELKDRFDFMLRHGFCYSRLCKMLSSTPKFLNQNSEILEKKINFLASEMGSSSLYLDSFPTFICYDLEKRIQPRYRFYTWLIETGLCKKNYSLASLIATSEKNFIARVFSIHPVAPKFWLECFKLKSS